MHLDSGSCHRHQRQWTESRPMFSHSSGDSMFSAQSPRWKLWQILCLARLHDLQMVSSCGVLTTPLSPCKGAHPLPMAHLWMQSYWGWVSLCSPWPLPIPSLPSNASHWRDSDLMWQHMKSTAPRSKCSATVLYPRSNQEWGKQTNPDTTVFCMIIGWTLKKFNVWENKNSQGYCCWLK